MIDLNVVNAIAERCAEALKVKSCGALNRQQAAEYLAVSTRQLDKYASNGELPVVKHGTKTVFRIRDLDGLLDSRTIYKGTVFCKEVVE